MQIPRRTFLAAASAALTAQAHPNHAHNIQPEKLPPLVDMSRIASFVDPLPLPAVLQPQAKHPSRSNPAVLLPLYRIPMLEFERKVHRDIPPTRFWGYAGAVPGSTIEARRGHPFFIEWLNQLPSRHMFSIDHKIMGAEPGRPEVRTIAHVHGGVVPPDSDGYPENWFSPGSSTLSFYPNSQNPALLWYHDHAMGITRLNMMAGLFGLYVIRDDEEESLHLPSDQFEIPLVLFDRMLQRDGRLFYPVSQDPSAPWVPEFFGDSTLINGALLPYLNVQPRPYRFRLLNASNARFYSLSLANNQPFVQIGTDGGLLPAPVQLAEVSLIPGDRADLILDFAPCAGQSIVLQDGVLPLMQFRVARATPQKSSPLPPKLRQVERISEAAAVRTRELTLEEFDNLLAEPITHLLNGKRWHDPVTETPTLGTVEIWSLFNLTDDAHPIHLHLVQFQVLDRRPLDVPEYIYNKRTRYTGAAVPPEPTETGWKDTVRATPRAVTRIIVRFEGFPGRYVWHCHIAEHEDNEMMRPYELLPATEKM